MNFQSDKSSFRLCGYNTNLQIPYNQHKQVKKKTRKNDLINILLDKVTLKSDNKIYILHVRTI